MMVKEQIDVFVRSSVSPTVGCTVILSGEENRNPQLSITEQSPATVRSAWPAVM